MFWIFTVFHLNGAVSFVPSSFTLVSEHSLLLCTKMHKTVYDTSMRATRDFQRSNKNVSKKYELNLVVIGSDFISSMGKVLTISWVNVWVQWILSIKLPFSRIALDKTFYRIYSNSDHLRNIGMNILNLYSYKINQNLVARSHLICMWTLVGVYIESQIMR